MKREEIKIKRKLRLTLSFRRSLLGWLFTAPFTIGLIFFFLKPFITTLVLSFNEMQIAQNGYQLSYVGWENYRHIFMVNPNYTRTLVEAIIKMFGDVPVILSFSLFMAIILNQRFKGRFIARIIFFLPVILTSEIVLRLEQSDYITGLLAEGDSIGFLSGEALIMLLQTLKLPGNMTQYVLTLIDKIPDIIKASGIQILVFLAGLQSIPSSLYEAAQVEGSTNWESFWMITFPMLTPIMITNIVYTIVDSFMAINNPMPKLISDTAFGRTGSFGISSAMSTVYFAVITIILLIAMGVISRKVFYHEL